MKKTPDKTEGQSEDNKNTQALEAINTLEWGVYTTLAWIKFRNVEIVNKVFETALRSGGDTRETKKTLAESSNEKFILNTQSILRKSLYEGKVDCFGTRNKIGTRNESSEKIDKQEWRDLDFAFLVIDSMLVGVTPTLKAIKSNSVQTWDDLKFIVSEVMEVWPDDGNNDKQPFPSDTKWEDMTWTFLSNELVKVEGKGVSEKYQYSELGFTDKRKGDTPNTRWAILSEFAKNNGEISWKSDINNKEKNRMTAAVRDIRKRLKKEFNINDDPFYPYRNTNSYKTKFTIKDNRHIDNIGDSEPRGFSEEEVIEHLNNSG